MTVFYIKTVWPMIGFFMGVYFSCFPYPHLSVWVKKFALAAFIKLLSSITGLISKTMLCRIPILSLPTPFHFHFYIIQQNISIYIIHFMFILARQPSSALEKISWLCLSIIIILTRIIHFSSWIYKKNAVKMDFVRLFEEFYLVSILFIVGVFFNQEKFLKVFFSLNCFDFIVKAFWMCRYYNGYWYRKCK